MIHHADEWLTIHGGDARDVLPTLPAESVDCIVTSPPYWGLRDYGTATWLGGDAECDHQDSQLGLEATRRDWITPMRATCTQCGATRQDSQLGLEATPEEYVANLVGVFRELRRVLKRSGTCWLNLGDSYAGARLPGGGTMAGFNDRYFGRKTDGGKQLEGDLAKPMRPAVTGLKPKDLVGIPWRVAFALQADGWWLRSDIIWAKPNPMPESVTDRPTKAHEYLFLLTKAERYYFDQEAVRESAAESSIQRGHLLKRQSSKGLEQPESHATNGHGLYQTSYDYGGRNLRSVWTIATRPYPGAHFAVFPPELPERCIKAGSGERGVCSECGVPWRRVEERTTIDYGMGEADTTNHKAVLVNQDGRKALRSPTGHTLTKTNTRTVGWIPSCAHDLEPVGAVVLDPFAGSGTVGLVANRLSRRAILIDLNPAYLEQQMKRNAQVPAGL